MKKLLFVLIKIYQNFVSPTLKQLLGVKSFCRYSLTCSEYAKVQIEKEGAIKGLGLAIKRILSCQPFSKKYEYI